MQLDSAALFVLMKELRKEIVPSRVRQIRQIDNRIIDMELYRTELPQVHLIFDTATPIVYLSHPSRNENRYISPQTFCMSLRKHLENSRLSRIGQIESDRLLRFDFDRIERAGFITTKELYMELIPSSPNLVLAEKNIILDACLKGKKQERLLFPQETYVFPTNSSRMNFLSFSEEEWIQLLSHSPVNKISISDWFFQNFNGFSRFSVEEIADDAGVSPLADLSSLSDSQKFSLAASVIHYRQNLISANGVRLYENDKGKSFVSPIILHRYENHEISQEAVPFLPYIEKEMADAVSTPPSAIKQLRKKVIGAYNKERRKADKIAAEAEETKQINTYKLWGQLLSIYAYEKTNRREEIILANLFADPPVPEKIPVNPRLTLSENSQIYFKKYNKMKTRLSFARKKSEEISTRLQYLKNLLYFIDSVSTKEELSALEEEWSRTEKSRSQNSPSGKKTDKESRIPFVCIDGYMIYRGRNNRENELLTIRKAKKTDLWLHAKGIPGSHVVIASEGKAVPDDVIAKAAEWAAFHSEGKNSGKVDVDVTEIRYVKKIPSAPLGMVSYTQQKTLTVSPLDKKSDTFPE